MIPKCVVFTWINDGTPDTPVMRECFASWRRTMPDYDIVRVDSGNVSRKSRYVRRALAAGCWVNASNYARLEYLYRHGGIYLDVDIEAVRSFDGLLSDACFLGVESPSRVNQAVVGAEPGHWFLKECMERLEANYRGDAPSEFAAQTGPLLVTEVLRDHGWMPGDATTLVNDVRVYESRYFYPYHFSEARSAARITQETRCIHRWAQGWLPWRKRVEAAVLGHGPIGGLRHWVAAARGRAE